jgi:hypothetical protein
MWIPARNSRPTAAAPVARASGGDSVHGPVERQEVAVAELLHDATAMPRRLDLDEGVECFELAHPGGIACLFQMAGRSDHVREDDGRDLAIGHVVLSAREELQQRVEAALV